MQPERGNDDPTGPTLGQVVAAMTDGDPGATERFFVLAEPRVRAIVLGSLQEAGIWLDRDRLHDIVHDSILELVRTAPSWRPDGGAAPWNWARARLVAMAFDHLGIFADDLTAHPDLEHTGEPATRDDTSPEDLLAQLGSRHPAVGQLHRALALVASDRDRRVWIDLLWEESGGNRRAAVTVAQTHGLSHGNVRKIRQRVQRRLVGLSTSDDFADLADLPLLAA